MANHSFMLKSNKMKTLAELAAQLPEGAVLSPQACRHVKGGENPPPPPPEDFVGNDDILDG
jgi:hypothetical protein